MSFATLGVLQPLTLHAMPAGETISGSEPPSLAQETLPHDQLVTPLPVALKVVSIDDGGTIIVVKSSAVLVRTALAEQAIFVNEQDIVEPSLDSPLDLLRTIIVTRVTSKEVVQQTSVPFTTSNRQDPSRTVGVETVQQKGIVGSVTVHTSIVLHNGIEASRSTIGSERTAPTEQIVLHGTKQADVSRGGASWYDGGPGPLTAAHRTLPFGTKVLVTNQANGLSVVVTIGDRGPFIGGRIIDLSPDSFAKIAGLGSGVVQVLVTRL